VCFRNTKKRPIPTNNSDVESLKTLLSHIKTSC
jgi:hypothetical protein